MFEDFRYNARRSRILEIRYLLDFGIRNFRLTMKEDRRIPKKDASTLFYDFCFHSTTLLKIYLTFCENLCTYHPQSQMPLCLLWSFARIIIKCLPGEVLLINLRYSIGIGYVMI